MKKFNLCWIITYFTITSVLASLPSELQKLELCWEYGKVNIYPKVLSEKFTDKQLRILKEKIENGEKLSEVLNPFLKGLNISHTYIYDDHDLGFYFLKSLFKTKDINSPEAVTIGAQLEKVQIGLRINAILDGLPADNVGLQIDDVISNVDGLKPKSAAIFFPFAKKEIEIEIIRNKKVIRKRIKPILSSIHKSFLEATQNSIKIIERNRKKIGYIHLWAGTNNDFLEILKKTILTNFKGVDGIILDLRDGYGGAWWEYLDPFFPNTKDYFIAKKIDRFGKVEILKPELKENPDFYSGKMVVLINNGVRSGKEALAYQFKKSGRATLIGTNTQGAFTAGQGGFSEKNFDFIFYLSISEIFLDGHKVEGIGISPDVKIENKVVGKDSQLESAINALL